MIVFDTETTGLLKPEAVGAVQQPQIIDFAAVKICDSTGEELDRIEFLVNPGISLPPEITKITGYVDADLRDKPPFAAYLGRLSEFFLGERAYCAHNLPFDKGMLHWELVRLDKLTAFPWPSQGICTAALSAEEYGRRLKLIELYERRLGKKLDQKHTAMADVEALLEVVRDWRLWELVDGPKRLMPPAMPPAVAKKTSSARRRKDDAK